MTFPVTQRTPHPQGTQTLSYHPKCHFGEDRVRKEGHSSGLPSSCVNSFVTSKRLHPPACPLMHSLRGRVCLSPTPCPQREGHTHPKFGTFIQQLFRERLLQIRFSGYLLRLPLFSVPEACRMSPEAGGEPRRHHYVRTEATRTRNG